MLTFMLTCVKCTSNVASLGWGGGDVNVHVNLRHMHISRYVTGLGGVGMLTFMLACVKCTSHVTSLGWGGGDVNVHVNLRLSKSAIVPRPDPTAMLTQSWCEASGCGSGVGWTPRPKVWWRSQVKPWRIVWQCEWKKNRASFQAQFPVNYKSSLKNHFKIPGIFKTILGNESAVSLWRKRHFFFQNAQNAGAVFPPAGCLCVRV